MNTHFPAYRTFKTARIEAIDAMTALLIGSRLSITNLRAVKNQETMLPDIYNGVAGIERLNRTASDAVTLLTTSEKHLAYMAIPYGLAVYAGFLTDVAKMLQADGRNPRTMERQEDLSKLSLDIAHEYISDCCQAGLDYEYVSLFQFSRRIRNRIIHFNGTAGSHIDYANLSQEAKEIWLNLARRPFTECVHDNRLLLGDSELLAVLGVCNELANKINALLSTAISRTYWARLAVTDFKACYPERFKETNNRLRHLEGYAYHLYRPIGLTSEEISDALDAVSNQ